VFNSGAPVPSFFQSRACIKPVGQGESYDLTNS